MDYNQKLDELKESCGKEGWDSYHAAPLSDEAVDTARRMLGSAFICPTVNGGLSLSWLQESIELEINAEGEIEALYFSLGDAKDYLAKLREKSE